MITVSQKLKIIHACFGKYSISGNEKNASIVCPYCRSNGKITKKKKLSIDLDKGIYHCWVCESKGKNIGRVAIKFSKDKAAAKILANYFGGIKKQDLEEAKQDLLSLPEDFKILTNLSNYERKKFKNHLLYLKNRGITELDIKRFCIGCSEEFLYKDHIIFPSFDIKGRLNYFIARSIDPNNPRRYKNCNISRKDIIFRHFNIDFTKELILTEGVFDLIGCPSNSTCILGSWLDDSYFLFKEIVRNKTPVVLCLDEDARAKSMKICKLLSSYCISVRQVENTSKDFGDMSKSEIDFYIKSAKQYDFAQSVGYLINNISSGSLFRSKK